jgi:hypothetical protein
MAWQFSEKFKQSQSKDPLAYGGGGSHPLLIGIPHNNFFSGNFLKGMRALDSPVPWIDFYTSGYQLDEARNVIVSKMLQHHCDYLFFVDSDIILRQNTLRNLMEFQMPIVSAVYMSRAPPYQPVALAGGKPLSHTITKLDPPQLIEVEQCGMGCILIERRVIERISKKINKFRCLIDHTKEAGLAVVTYMDQEARRLNYSCRYCKGLLISNFFKTTLGTDDENPMSEDYYFCKLARQAGYQIFVQSNNIVGHEPRQGDWIIDERGLTSNQSNAAYILSEEETDINNQNK